MSDSTRYPRQVPALRCRHRRAIHGCVLGLRRAEKALRETPFVHEGRQFEIRFTAGMILANRVIPVDDVIAAGPVVFREDSREGETTIKYDLTLYAGERGRSRRDSTRRYFGWTTTWRRRWATTGPSR